MPETRESPIFCAKCGKVVLWIKVADSNVVAFLSDCFEFDDAWWLLDIPCACGSQLFNVRVDHPMAHGRIEGIEVS